MSNLKGRPASDRELRETAAHPPSRVERHPYDFSSLDLDDRFTSVVGGTFEVASMPGRGSTFTVLRSLPRQVLND